MTYPHLETLISSEWSEDRSAIHVARDVAIALTIRGEHPLLCRLLESLAEQAEAALPSPRSPA